jgi:hypothetical protein
LDEIDDSELTFFPVFDVSGLRGDVSSVLNYFRNYDDKGE